MRFKQHRVCSQCHRLFGHLFGGGDGEDDDRGAGGLGIEAKGAENAQAVHSGHDHIEENQVGSSAAGGDQRFLAALQEDRIVLSLFI